MKIFGIMGWKNSGKTGLMERLVAGLRAVGRLDGTVLIITSDHGEAFDDHGLFGHATGLLFEQVWVPLVLAGPGIPAGITVDQPVSLRDIASTVMERAQPPSGGGWPGASLSRCWDDDPGNDTATVFAEIAQRDSWNTELDVTHGDLHTIITREHQYLRSVRGQVRAECADDTSDTTNIDTDPRHAWTRQALSRVLDSMLTRSGRDPR